MALVSSDANLGRFLTASGSLAFDCANSNDLPNFLFFEIASAAGFSKKIDNKEFLLKMLVTEIRFLMKGKDESVLFSK